MKQFGLFITVLSFSQCLFCHDLLSIPASMLLLCFWFFMAVLLCLIYDSPGVAHLK